MQFSSGDLEQSSIQHDLETAGIQDLQQQLRRSARRNRSRGIPLLHCIGCSNKINMYFLYLPGHRIDPDLTNCEMGICVNPMAEDWLICDKCHHSYHGA